MDIRHLPVVILVNFCYATAMSIFVAKAGSRLKKDGSRDFHWALKENYWDAKAKAQRQKHLAYIGKSLTITESKARAICAAKGLTLEQLQAVKGLKVVPDEQVSPNGRRQRAKDRRVGPRGHGQE